MQQSSSISVRWIGDELMCAGLVDFQNANDFIDQFSEIDFPENAPIKINFTDFIIADGLALLVLGKSLVSVARRFKGLQIFNASLEIEEYVSRSLNLKNVFFEDKVEQAQRVLESVSA